MSVTQQFILDLDPEQYDADDGTLTIDRRAAEALFQELGQALYPNYQANDDEPEEPEWAPIEPDAPADPDASTERLTVDQAERRLAAQQVLDRMVPARPQQNAGSGIGQAHI